MESITDTDYDTSLVSLAVTRQAILQEIYNLLYSSGMGAKKAGIVSDLIREYRHVTRSRDRYFLRSIGYDVPLAD